MFENPRRGRQARNFTTNVPKILVLKSSSEQIFSRKLPLGAPAVSVFAHQFDVSARGSVIYCFQSFANWRFVSVTKQWQKRSLKGQLVQKNR